jgi:hypothetical protein
VRTSEDRIYSILVVMTLVTSLYFSPDYDLAGVRLPNFPPIIFCCALFFFGLKDYKLDKEYFLFLASCLVVVFADLLFVPGPIEYFQERITGAFQFFSGLFIFASCIQFSKRSTFKMVDRFASYLLFFLLLVSALERTGAINDVSALVRERLYEFSLYVGYERDYRSYGFSRPMAFLKEPAHLAWLSSLLGFYLYKRGCIKLGTVLFVGFFFLFLVSSPVCITIFLALFVDYLFRAKIGLILIAPLVLSFGSFLSIILFSSRIDGFLGGGDISLLSRVVGPPLVAFNVVLDYPLFGTGVTADTLVANYVYSVFFEFANLSALEAIDDSVLAKRVNNYVFQLFVYFGILGTLALSLILMRYTRRFSDSTGVILVQFFVFSLGMGGLVLPKVFACLYLLYVCYFKLKKVGGR